jgi:hypothetical protein
MPVHIGCMGSHIVTWNLAYRLGRLYIISPSNSIDSLFNPSVHVWVGTWHVILGNKTVLEGLKVSSNWVHGMCLKRLGLEELRI